MIEATVQEVRDAYRALRRIAEEVRLPQKPAWRISRMLKKLLPEIESFEETQLKLLRDAGGVERDGGVALESPKRGDDEAQAAFDMRQADYHAKVNGLNKQLRALGKNKVKIEYDPIPLSLFAVKDDEKLPADRRMRFSPNDFADAGPFITEAEAAPPES